MAQISREEWLRRFGRSVERPQPQNIVGLPSPDARYSPGEIRQALIDSGQIHELAGGSNQNPRYLTRQIEEDEQYKGYLREKLIGGDLSAISAAGMPDQSVWIAERARQYAEIGGISVPDAVNLAVLEAQQLASAAEGGRTGPLRAQRLSASPAVGLVGGDQAVSELLNRLAQAGETREDPVMSQLVQQLNSVASRKAGAGGVSDDLPPAVGDTSYVNEAVERAATELLSEGELARVAADVMARSSGRAEPLRQLSRTETEALAASEGKGKTVGGRRNATRKESRGSEIAGLLRAPGNVLGAGLDQSAADMLVPILIAPKSQQRWSAGTKWGPYSDASGPVMQATQYYLGKNEAGKAVFAPALRDARILYVNPYAELTDEAVRRLSLDQVPIKPEKDTSGAYDQAALNVPIPDVGESESGFTPKYDPSYGNRRIRQSGNGTIDSGGEAFRNPTVAEAFRQLGQRHQTPIRAVTRDMLLRGGTEYDDFIQGADGSLQPVFALGSKRTADGKPAPISAYFQSPVAPGADDVADVRYGSGRKYQDSYFGDLDEFVDELAGQAYGWQGGSRPLVATERSTGDRYRPEIVREPVRYGALLNLASTDAVVADYQRRLLNEAGFLMEGAEGRNPLMAIVSAIEGLADAPPGDVPLRRAALTGSGAESIVAPAGRSGAASLLPRAVGRMSDAGRAQASTDSARQASERAARDFLRRLVEQGASEERPVGGDAGYGVFRDPLGIPQPRYRQPVIPGLEGEILHPQVTAMDPVTRDVARYMAARAPQVAGTRRQDAVQLVPRELYNRFFVPSAPPAAPATAPLQEQAAARLFSGRPVQAALPGVSPSAAEYLPDQSALGRLGQMMERRSVIESDVARDTALTKLLALPATSERRNPVAPLGAVATTDQGLLPGLGKALQRARELNASKSAVASRAQSEVLAQWLQSEGNPFYGAPGRARGA